MTAKGVQSATLGYVIDTLVVDDPISTMRCARSLGFLGDLHGWWDESLMCRLAPGASVVAVQDQDALR
jgi:hypothetical protein